MTRAIVRHVHLAWSALWIGTALGTAWAFILVAGPLVSDQIRYYSYKVWPVVVMTGELIKEENGSALIHIKGIKARQCEFKRIAAYVQRHDGTFDDSVELLRVAGPTDGESKPLGKWDLGEWIIRPTDARTSRVVVYSLHECGEDLIRTSIANVRVGAFPPRFNNVELDGNR